MNRQVSGQLGSEVLRQSTLLLPPLQIQFPLDALLPTGLHLACFPPVPIPFLQLQHQQWQAQPSSQPRSSTFTGSCGPTGPTRVPQASLLVMRSAD